MANTVDLIERSRDLMRDIAADRRLAVAAPCVVSASAALDCLAARQRELAETERELARRGY